jgi:hypothetical protein
MKVTLVKSDEVTKLSLIYRVLRRIQMFHTGASIMGRARILSKVAGESQKIFLQTYTQEFISYETSVYSGKIIFKLILLFDINVWYIASFLNFDFFRFVLSPLPTTTASTITDVGRIATNHE